MAQKVIAAGDLSFTSLDLGAGVRTLNVDLSKDSVDFSNYDRVNGKGSAKVIVDMLALTLYAERHSVKKPCDVFSTLTLS